MHLLIEVFGGLKNEMPSRSWELKGEGRWRV